MKASQLAAPAILAVAVAACTGKHLASRPAWLDLGGTWQFNARETASLEGADSARRAPRAGRPPGGGGMPGMPGGGGMPGGRGGMPGGRGGMPGGGMPGGGPPAAGMLMAPPLERFTIEQTDSTVFFRFAPKEGVVVPTSWHKVSTEFWPGAQEMSLKAKWSEAGLVVEREVGVEDDGMGGEQPGGRRGTKITETYSRAPQSNRLVVTTEVGGRRMRNSYELVPPAAAQPPR